MDEAHRDPRRWRFFFVFMASVLLIIVAVGFMPSFYWPGSFGPPEAATINKDAPAYIIAHGVAMTSWFLLYFIQAMLAAGNKISVHQRLGIAGAVLATLLVPLNALVVARSVSRSGLGALPVMGDFAVLALFAVMVALAIRARKQPDVHKRLMLIATIAMTAPALARWPGAEAAVPFSVIVPHLLLMGAILVYDKVAHGRIQRATGWGIVAYVLVVGLTVPLAMSPVGQQVIQALQ